MARLVLKMSISIDGFVGSSDPTNRWNLAGGSPDSSAWLVEQLRGAGAHVMGRATYEVMAGFWPVTPGPVAEAMNEGRKIVFSNSLQSADWSGTTIVRGDLAEGLEALKAGDDGELLVQGGARFARSVVATGLVDEYRLVVHPVVLGAGVRLFDEPLWLKTVDTTVFSGGIVAHIFTAA